MSDEVLMVVLEDGESFSGIEGTRVMRVTRSGADRVSNNGGDAHSFRGREILNEYSISDLLKYFESTLPKEKISTLDEHLKS